MDSLVRDFSITSLRAPHMLCPAFTHVGAHKKAEAVINGFGFSFYATQRA
jgi:hypothetical protein